MPSMALVTFVWVVTMMVMVVGLPPGDEGLGPPPTSHDESVFVPNSFTEPKGVCVELTPVQDEQLMDAAGAVGWAQKKVPQGVGWKPWSLKDAGQPGSPPGGPPPPYPLPAQPMKPPQKPSGPQPEPAAPAAAPAPQVPPPAPVAQRPQGDCFNSVLFYRMATAQWLDTHARFYPPRTHKLDRGVMVFEEGEADNEKLFEVPLLPAHRLCELRSHYVKLRVSKRPTAPAGGKFFIGLSDGKSFVGFARTDDGTFVVGRPLAATDGDQLSEADWGHPMGSFPMHPFTFDLFVVLGDRTTVFVRVDDAITPVVWTSPLQLACERPLKLEVFANAAAERYQLYFIEISVRKDGLYNHLLTSDFLMQNDKVLLYGETNLWDDLLAIRPREDHAKLFQVPFVPQGFLTNRGPYSVRMSVAAKSFTTDLDDIYFGLSDFDCENPAPGHVLGFERSVNKATVGNVFTATDVGKRFEERKNQTEAGAPLRRHISFEEYVTVDGGQTIVSGRVGDIVRPGAYSVPPERQLDATKAVNFVAFSDFASERVGIYGIELELLTEGLNAPCYWHRHMTAEWLDLNANFMSSRLRRTIDSRIDIMVNVPDELIGRWKMCQKSILEAGGQVDSLKLMLFPEIYDPDYTPPPSPTPSSSPPPSSSPTRSPPPRPPPRRHRPRIARAAPVRRPRRRVHPWAWLFPWLRRGEVVPADVLAAQSNVTMNEEDAAKQEEGEGALSSAAFIQLTSVEAEETGEAETETETETEAEGLMSENDDPSMVAHAQMGLASVPVPTLAPSPTPNLAGQLENIARQARGAADEANDQHGSLKGVQAKVDDISAAMRDALPLLHRLQDLVPGQDFVSANPPVTLPVSPSPRPSFVRRARRPPARSPSPSPSPVMELTDGTDLLLSHFLGGAPGTSAMKGLTKDGEVWSMRDQAGTASYGLGVDCPGNYAKNAVRFRMPNGSEKTFELSIGMHPYQRVTFYLDKFRKEYSDPDISSFSAWAGLDLGSNGNGPTTFNVYVDGIRRRSVNIDRGGRAREITVNLRGAKQLVLETKWYRVLRANHAAWGDPRLHRLEPSPRSYPNHPDMLDIEGVCQKILEPFVPALRQRRGEKLLEAPIDMEPGFCNGQECMLRVAVSYAPLVLETSLMIGISDGSNVVGFHRADAPIDGHIGAPFACRDGGACTNPTYGPQGGETDLLHGFVEFFLLLGKKNTSLYANVNPLIKPAVWVDAPALNLASNSLKVVVFADHAFESFGLYYIDVSVVRQGMRLWKKSGRQQGLLGP